MVNGKDSVIAWFTAQNRPVFRIYANGSKFPMRQAEGVQDLNDILMILMPGRYAIRCKPKKENVDAEDEATWNTGYTTTVFDIPYQPGMQPTQQGNGAVMSMAESEDRFEKRLAEKIKDETEKLQLKYRLDAMEEKLKEKKEKKSTTQELMQIAGMILQGINGGGMPQQLPQPRMGTLVTHGAPKQQPQQGAAQPAQVETATIEKTEITDEMMQQIHAEVEKLLNNHCNGDAELLILRLRNLNDKLDKTPALISFID